MERTMPELLELPPWDVDLPRAWIIKGHLPAAELVLLDGLTGVGKSSTAAHYASYVSKQYMDDNPAAVLYVSSGIQTFARNKHLGLNDANRSTIRMVDLEPLYQLPASGEFIVGFAELLESHIKEHTPLLIVIDSIEEIMKRIKKLDESDARYLFTSLRWLARKYACTILIPRTSGMHERHYSTLGRAGTAICEFILTLHWHPTVAERRILILAKNNCGPMGTQWQHRYLPNGRFMCFDMEPHQHVQPARSPATWKGDPAIKYQMDELIDFIRHLMNDQKMTNPKELKSFLYGQGFSQHEVRETLSRMNLDCIRTDGAYHYIASKEADKKYQEIQTQREAREAEAVEYQIWLRKKVMEETILNQQAHTPAVPNQEEGPVITNTQELSIVKQTPAHTQRQAG
jgi:KaiC/GvpD/RAD55 family RecA-like ATPase